MGIRDDENFSPGRAAYEKAANKSYDSAMETAKVIPLSALTLSDLLDILNTEGQRYANGRHDHSIWRKSMAEKVISLAGRINNK